MSLTVLPGLAPVADRYDAVILDLWGVVHDGQKPFPGAPDCMRRLRASGRPVILLSNAPRRSHTVVKFLTENICLPDGCYDHIVTSGDLTYDALAAHKNGWRTYLRVGPERDWGLLDGLDYRSTDDPSKADFVLCSGLFNDATDQPADYDYLLKPALARKLEMICANPDLTVMRGETRLLCAGTLAAYYEEMGGTVSLFGKPLIGAYDACRAVVGAKASRFLAVGDSLRTDIAGARNANIDSVLVTCGIHADEWDHRPGEAPDGPRLIAAIGDRPMPTYAMSELRW